MEREQQRRIVEAVILASPEPLPPARIASVLPRCNPSQVRSLVDELNAEYADARRAFEIWEVAGGYQLRTLPEFAPYLKQLQAERPLRLSPASLETLAVVAYRQPVTRAEIEQIRGVDAGAVLRGLLDRQLLRIAGHREVPGRPIVYATSRRFLEVFGLAKLGDLPTLRAIEELAAAGDEDDDVNGSEAEAADAALAAAADDDGAEAELDAAADREDPVADLGDRVADLEDPEVETEAPPGLPH